MRTPLVIELALLTLGFFGLFAPRPGGAVDLKQLQEIAELQAQIHSLNLVNHLYLTKDQASKLLALARENKALEESGERGLLAVKGPYVQALQSLRDELLKVPDPAPDVKKSFNAEKEKVDSLRESFEKSREGMVARARQVLSENQLIIVSEYKACLIPIKNLADPSRIGQASDNSVALRLLDKARTLPERKYLANKEKALHKLVEKLSRFYEAEEIPALMETISKTFDEARAMSDADYELKKGELAKRISPKEMEPRTGKALNNAIARFLLDPQAIVVLEAAAR